jgi:glycosyltransferase involved in cell wall biosynthesis
MHSSDSFYQGLLSEFVLGFPEYNLSALVVVSRYLEDQAISRKPQTTIIRRIPCGVPLPSLTTHYPDGVLRLVYAGRLTEEAKRITEVTRALCKVARVVHGTEAYIYGDGEGRLAVEKILSQEGKNSSVFFKGSVDSDTIQDHLLNGHIFVLLSDYEGLPISLMEAMACGLVPVCLEIKGGVSELIDDGLNGFKVSDRSDSLIEAVEKLRGDRGLWKQLSTQARATIENEYVHERCVSLWGQLFEELVPSNRVKREIVLPGQIKLPPVNSGLAREDQRSLRGFSLVKSNLAGALRNLGRHLSPFISRSPSP